MFDVGRSMFSKKPDNLGVKSPATIDLIHKTISWMNTLAYVLSRTVFSSFLKTKFKYSWLALNILAGK
jgi:hypothetical protein